jgi:hypothetical protein
VLDSVLLALENTCFRILQNWRETRALAASFIFLEKIACIFTFVLAIVRGKSCCQIWKFGAGTILASNHALHEFFL